MFFSQWSWFVRSPRSSSGAKQESILPHIFAVPGVVCGADTTAKIWIKIWVGMWLPHKLSHLTSSHGARNDCSKIENNKTQQPENTANNNQILAAVIAHLQDARHPIHRVRIPYAKFPSPKTCRNVHKSSSLSNAPMTSLTRMRARSRNCMTSQTWKQRKHALTFLVFPSVKVVCMLRDIDDYFTI